MTNTNIDWSLRGRYVEACSCDAGCPCKFGADPTKGYCDGILGFRIDEGRFGQQDLSGLGMVLAMHAPASPFKGEIAATAYIDDRATAEQRQALETILSGKAGGLWEVVMDGLVTDFRGIKYAPVSMETSGDRWTVEIPDLIDVVNEPLTDPLTGKVQDIMVSETFDPFCRSGRAGRSAKAVCSDPDLSFDVTGQQGYVGPFEWAGP